MIKNNFVFLLSFTLRSALLTIIILLIYGLFFHFTNGGNLLYYKGILAISAIFISIFILLFIRGGFEKNFPALVAGTVLAYSFHVTIPVILDRSISIQTIGSLNNQSLSIEKLNESFLKGYVDGYSTICRRLEEQLATGNVVINSDKIVLTKKGHIMQRIFNYIAEFMKIEDHYIKGELGDNYIHHYDMVNDRCINYKSRDLK